MARQYCYRLKAEGVDEHLTRVGQVMHRLVRELEAGYGEQPAYRMLRRVFEEHFVCQAGEGDGSPAAQIRVKEDDELSSGGLQAPDDGEASHRVKVEQEYRGYVANVTETCRQENDVQLITKVQVAPNNTDDEDLGVAAVPELKERTALEELWTDGGYPGPDAEAVCREYQVTHIPTNLRGRRPNPDRWGFADFAWGLDDEDVPQTVHCPGGQGVPVRPGFGSERFWCDFARSECASCPWADQCPTEPLIRRPARVLRVSLRQVHIARLRQRARRARQPGNNRRAAIESTVRSVIHPFGGRAGKLPVRGQIRVTQMILCSALMVNLRRIYRYQRLLTEDPVAEVPSLLSHIHACPTAWLHKNPVCSATCFALTGVDRLVLAEPSPQLNRRRRIFSGKPIWDRTLPCCPSTSDSAVKSLLSYRAEWRHTPGTDSRCQPASRWWSRLSTSPPPHGCAGPKAIPPPAPGA